MKSVGGMKKDEEFGGMKKDEEDWGLLRHAAYGSREWQSLAFTDYDDSKRSFRNQRECKA